MEKIHFYIQFTQLLLISANDSLKYQLHTNLPLFTTIYHWDLKANTMRIHSKLFK